MQLFILIVMEDQFPQFDPDRFTHLLPVHIHCLKQPAPIRKPAVAELFLIKTFLGFHASCLSAAALFLLSLAYYENDASIRRNRSMASAALCLSALDSSTTVEQAAPVVFDPSSQLCL